MNIPRTIAFAALAGASVFAFGQAAGQNIVPLAKNPPAKMLMAVSVGHKTATDVVHVAVGIQPADAAGMQAYADAVSDPSNPLYRQFLTPEEIGARFGLPLNRIQRIEDYLASKGMNVTLVAKNRFTILADATVTQAENAFHTTIEKFASKGAPSLADGEYFSFTTPPAVPTNIAGDIVDVSGLESFTQPKHLNPLTPGDVRQVYTTASMYNNGLRGQGRTVAISSFDGFSLSNIPLLVNQFNLPTPTGGVGSNVSVISVSGGDGPNLNATGEADLDIQSILGVAPLCTLLIYDNDLPPNDNNYDPIGVYTKELNDNKADVISESYGWSFDTATAAQAHTLHVSMTAQGITYLAAAGDSGTAWDAVKNPYWYPDIDPEVLSIGGTSVTIDQNGNRLTETGWNSDGGAGGGGWVATADGFNTRPAWQRAAKFLAQPMVPNTVIAPYRLFPDISLDADPQTGYIIYVQGQAMQIGGTSGASPTSAASWALVEEQLVANGSLKADTHGHFRLGRLQDAIYGWNGDSSLIFDVTVGNNGALPNGTQSNAGIGWDTDTGWGVPIFSAIAAKLTVVTAPALTAVVINPTTVRGGTSSQGQVNLSAAAGSGGVTVTLTSSTTAAIVPKTVVVPEGSAFVTFTITTGAVTANKTATITAKSGKVSKTATLMVQPDTIALLTVSSTSVTGGSNSSVTGTVTLSAAAPSTGLTVTLSSSKTTAASVPASVKVAAGQTTATFTVKHLVVAAAANPTLTAKLNGSSATASLTVNPFHVSGLTLTPTSVAGGSSSTGTVTLNATVGSTTGVKVVLTSSSTSAKPPTSVTVGAGKSTATITVKTSAVKSATTATIKAAIGSSNSTATLTILPPGLKNITIAPGSVQGSAATHVVGTISLTSIAPAGGLKVFLTSSNTIAASVPASVVVPAGHTSAVFTITHRKVTSLIVSTITASLGAGSGSATITVTP